MARIPLLDADDPAVPADTRDWLREAARTRGRALNVYRAMANRPEAARAFSAMIKAVYRGDSSLEPRHGELAYLTATVTNDCFY